MSLSFQLTEKRVLVPCLLRQYPDYLKKFKKILPRWKHDYRGNGKRYFYLDEKHRKREKRKIWDFFGVNL